MSRDLFAILLCSELVQGTCEESNLQKFKMVFFETCGPNEAMVVSGIFVTLHILTFVLLW